MLNKLKGDNMKLTTKYIGSDWWGEHFQVTINGRKYPRERGCNYIVPFDNYDHAEERAKELAVAEWEGKYISRGGVIYADEEAYHQAMEIEDELYER